MYDNVAHLKLFKESGYGGITYPIPTSVPLPVSTSCTNSFVNNGYAKVYEYEMQMQRPTLVSFVPHDTIGLIEDIEGKMPHYNGINVNILKLYSREDMILNGITIYYMDLTSNGIIRKFSPLYQLNISGSTLTDGQLLIPKDVQCISNIGHAITNTSHVYRIKISMSNTTNFSRFLLNMVGSNGDFVITSCMGKNDFYLDLVGNTPIPIAGICDTSLMYQVFSSVDLKNSTYYSRYNPSSTNILKTYQDKQWLVSGPSSIGTAVGNLRTPITDMYIITINSDISTLINNYVGIYYKLPNELDIKYKKLDKYLITPANISSSTLGPKLLDEPVVVDRGNMLLCMDDIMGAYEIYEIEIEMNNMDWAQVQICFANQTGEIYKNIICLRNNKININVFGRLDRYLVMRNLLKCSNAIAGQAYTNIIVKDIKFNIDPYIEHCTPLTLTYTYPISLQGKPIVNKGLTLINSINIINIGDVKVELSQVRCFYTTSVNDISVIKMLSLSDRYSSGIQLPSILLPGVTYGLNTNADINISISELEIMYLQRIEFTTTQKDLSQICVVFSCGQKNNMDQYILDPNGNRVMKQAIFVCCVMNNTTSFDFI
jgi:hypothetical protein